MLLRELNSPFAEERLYERSGEADGEALLELLESESPFRDAFEGLEEEAFGAEEEWDSEDYFSERAPEEFAAEDEEAAVEAEGFEAEEAEIPSEIAQFAARLAPERARYSKRTAAAEEAALLQDYRDTQTGGRLRFTRSRVYGKPPYTAAGIARAWMASREEQMRFNASPIKRLNIVAPAERVALVEHPLVAGSRQDPVAPLTGRFAEELKRRSPGMTAKNYPGHGGGSFLNRGYSLDLYIDAKKDSRGFWNPDDALRFLHAVHAAAAAVNAQWRVIYNDFSVADAINRATGWKHVIFVGTPARNKARQVVNLNWHGPHPLILHFHLDLAPRAAGGGGAPAPLPPRPAPRPSPAPAPAKPAGELVRFAQRVLNGTEGERLSVDGDMGPLTRGALERFRKRVALGPGGVLDAKTELALAQRVLEELAQQSLFAPGVRDEKTEQALRNFKAERGLAPNAVLDAATRAALADALERRSAPRPRPLPVPARPPSPSGATDWTRVSDDQRMARVVRLLVEKYGYPVNGAAGIVGNLWEESGVLPGRLEGSQAGTPMRARDFSNVVRDFTPEQIMNRNASTKQGPRLPGIGLAQWTSPGRRAGLFRHSYQGRVLGPAILFDLEAQVDYLVAELRSQYRGVDAVLRRPGISPDAASDEVVYSFEVPGSVLTPPELGPRRRLPRDHPAVQQVFARRRTASRRALQAYGGSAGEAEQEEMELLEAEDDSELHDHEAVDGEMIDEEQLEEEEPGEEALEGGEEEALDEAEDELDPTLLDIAERTMAREAPELEEQVAASRWTRCFSAADVAKVEQVYQDNEGAATANGIDRCSCIVMLNVALGQLLSLPLKTNRARGTSTRTVQMGNLTTKSIEKAMQQLRGRGYARPPTLMNFLDRRNKTAGTLRPEKLKASVQAKVLALAGTEKCWFAFGLSIMDGYHSVLLLVDRTGTNARIFWLDQFSSGVSDDVTTGLDQRITDKTQGWWDGVRATKGKGYNTTIRIWPLRKLRKTP